jgi:RNA polymerase sigma-70 factor (ECF subfamily)
MGEQRPDEELMRAVGRGDAAAFAELYHRHKEALLGFCFRMLRNWEDSADVFQDAFRYLHQHAATYQPTARFTTYLYHIARNMCIDILRRRRRWSPEPLDPGRIPADPSTEAPVTIDPGELESKIKKALGEIPEPFRDVLHLRIVEDLGYEEIAQIIECPLGTVKSRIHAGLELLRQILRRRNILEE